MKKNTKVTNQSSVPVQHSHTPDNNSETPRSALPAPRSDSRLPIDYALRDTNRHLDTATVVAMLRDTRPDLCAKAQVVGSWVWLAFDTAPEPTTRQQISQLGFHWNGTRQVWQHPCGKFSFSSKADPRENYASKPAVEAFN